MKVLFVYYNITGHESTHQGLMSLSSYVKQLGHETGLLDFTFGPNPGKMIRRAKRFQPDIVAFTALSGTFDASIEFARDLKKELRVPVVFGGIHPTLCPQETIVKDCVDIVCVGEGEKALSKLLQRMKEGEHYSDIPSLWVKDSNGSIVKNNPDELIKDLDTLPFPDFDLFDIEAFLEARDGSLDVISGRGCPFQCSYCANHGMQKIYNRFGREFTRKHSADYTINLLKHARDKYPVNFFSFEDDLFTFYKDWLISFCERYKREIGIPFSCNHRIGLAKSDIFKYLKEAHCTNIHMGIEAGSEAIRKRILHRNYSNKKVVETFNAAKAAGVGTTSYNILGSPFETEEDIKETIRVNQEIQPDHIGVTIFCPYPGTELYDLCINKGLIEKGFKTPRQHRTDITIDYDKYAKSLGRKIKRYKKAFRFLVYKKRSFRKALVFLLFDWNYEAFIFIRKKIPFKIKKFLYRGYKNFIRHKG